MADVLVTIEHPETQKRAKVSMKAFERVYGSGGWLLVSEEQLAQEDQERREEKQALAAAANNNVIAPGVEGVVDAPPDGADVVAVVDDPEDKPPV